MIENGDGIFHSSAGALADLFEVRFAFAYLDGVDVKGYNILGDT